MEVEGDNSITNLKKERVIKTAVNCCTVEGKNGWMDTWKEGWMVGEMVQ